MGPFATERPLMFLRNVTYIVGDCGTGKSTITRVLKADLVESPWGVAGNGAISDLIPFLIVDEETRIPYAGKAWELGAPMLKALTQVGVDDSFFAECFESNIREIMRSKIAGSSKFSGSLMSSEDIAASISEDFTIEISETVRGTDLNWAFQAAGERTALFLAAIGALRKVLPDWSHLPIVWDDFGGAADSALLPSFFSFLMKLECQVILLMSRRVAGLLGVDGDIDLSWDRGLAEDLVKIRQHGTLPTA